MRKRYILTDLSKGFGCICPDLSVAKPDGCGLSLPTLKKIEDYIFNRKQRTKIESSYSTWENSTEIDIGIPIFQHIFM